MSTDIIKQISDHLQFLGYEISPDGERVRAVHPRKFNILIRPLGGGVLFTAIFGCSSQAKIDRLGYLEVINSLNESAAVARFYADKDADLFIEAWYPDYYDRTEFGRFVDVWYRDCGLLSENTSLSKYLR